MIILPVILQWSEGNEIQTKVYCDANGDFTILIVSDPQCDNRVQWNEAHRELDILIKKSKPDLVIVCGDMNSNNKIPQDMWEDFVSPITNRGIYLATTNGNHDPFNEKHYRMYKSYGKCLNTKVSIFDENYERERPMNYVITVYSNDKKTPVFAIFLHGYRHI